MSIQMPRAGNDDPCGCVSVGETCDKTFQARCCATSGFLSCNAEVGGNITFTACNENTCNTQPASFGGTIVSCVGKSES